MLHAHQRHWACLGSFPVLSTTVFLLRIRLGDPVEKLLAVVSEGQQEAIINDGYGYAGGIFDPCTELLVVDHTSSTVDDEVVTTQEGWVGRESAPKGMFNLYSIAAALSEKMRYLHHADIITGVRNPIMVASFCDQNAVTSSKGLESF